MLLSGDHSFWYENKKLEEKECVVTLLGKTSGTDVER